MTAASPSALRRIEPHYLRSELYALVREDSRVFDFIQSGSLDGIWYWDIENPEHEWMSPRFWETLGYDPTVKPHLASAWQDIINQDDLALALENFQRHCDDPAHSYDQIVRYRHRDGSTVWIRCRGLAIRDSAGRPIRMLGAHSDVTSLKEAELKLQQKNDELLKYSYAISHDLKGPIGNAALALKIISTKYGSTMDAMSQRLIDELQLSMSRMTGVIEELHRIASLDETPDCTEVVSLSDTLAAVQRDVGSEIAQTQATITLNGDADITTSKILFTQVLYNLIQNAIKYRRDDIAPQIRVTACNTGVHWQISITDNGLGIAEENQGRVFEFLKRVHGKPNIPGVGLGLSFCKKAIERLGGSISLTSTLNEGSEFVLKLPVNVGLATAR